jgi:arsenite methyltransferase
VKARHASYGVDRPDLIIGTIALAGAFIVSSAVLAIADREILLIIGLAILSTTAVFALASPLKPRAAVELLGTLDWTGDEVVLDVGCGRGLWLITAAKHLTTGRAVGVDVWNARLQSGNSPERTLENARLEGVAGRVEVRYGRAQELPFEDDSFDVVLSSLVVHHIPRAEREKALREMVRVLRPGGQLAMLETFDQVKAYRKVIGKAGMTDIRAARSRSPSVRGFHTLVATKASGLLLEAVARHTVDSLHVSPETPRTRLGSYKGGVYVPYSARGPLEGSWGTLANNEFEVEGSREPTAPVEGARARKAEGERRALPIFSVIGSIDFGGHFVIIGDVGTGKSTVTPIHEFELSGRKRQVIIREPSRASCNALYYSLLALHPEVKDELSVVTKDTKINVGGKVKIVTDGVLLRMLAEGSVSGCSVYFDESHQMTSQLELCMSLARKQGAGNLYRVMSATIDPGEFMSFLGISKLYTLSGRRFPVRVEVELVGDVDEMLETTSRILRTQPRDESWLVFLPTRRLVETFARNFGGVYIHGGLEGSEVNRIQERAESDRNLKIFATNVIASSVNIYVDNVLVFNEVIDSKDTLGQKSLRYRKLENNSLLQMMGRIGRFKPGRAVIVSDVALPKKINPTPVRKDLESETPFDLVLLMAKYGLAFGELEFMSRVDQREVAFAEGWLTGIRAIDPHSRRITEKGLLMSEIPYEPDFANMISSALISGDYQMARFLLASGAFGDSLNHAYRTDMEVVATEVLYSYDRKNELNVKAHLLKRYAEDKDGAFVSKMAASGIYVRFVEEAWKNHEAARGALNDLLRSSSKEPIPKGVAVDPDVRKLEPYLEDCLSFERFDRHEASEYDLRRVDVEGSFFARSITMNFRRILFDIVALKVRGRRHRGRRRGRRRR